MPLKCCVVDDEPLASGLIAGYIRKTPFLELCGEFPSPHDAIATILKEDIDLIFLDIQMPQLSGIEFARIIPPTTRIIFTTAYSDYAVEGFRVNALDYLLKPISYKEFLAAAQRALKWKELTRKSTPPEESRTQESSPSESEYIIIKSEYKLIQLPVKDILYIEGLKDYVKIYVEGSDSSIMSLLSMKAIEQTLPPDKFMRVHRSFIVNLSKIRYIERNRIVIGKALIPISDTYKDAFADYVASKSVN